MDPLLAKALKYYRDRYDYPWAALRISTSGAIAIGAGLYIRFEDRAPKVTDLSLDHHQLSLLTAPASHAPHLWVGCGSAIYWGFRTFGTSSTFAKARATRFFTGNGHNPASATAAAVTRASAHCVARDWGQALGAIGEVHQLGQLPFASKVISFLDLDNAGVYDNRINGFLAATRLDQPMLGCDAIPVDRLGKMIYARASSKRNQVVYQRWCERLRQIREELKVLGPTYGWKCTETKPQKWRAVDVERAIFRLAKATLRPELGDFRPKARLPEASKSGSRYPASVDEQAMEDFDPIDVVRRLKEHCQSHPPTSGKNPRVL